MQCHACGTAVELATGERVGFRATCARCDADLHVCRNCAHHDPSAHNECREPNAEWVSDRERANRCEYFAPGSGSGFAVPAAGREAAKSALDDLFKKK